MQQMSTIVDLLSLLDVRRNAKRIEKSKGAPGSRRAQRAR
jgi:hypothetical protein